MALYGDQFGANSVFEYQLHQSLPMSDHKRLRTVIDQHCHRLSSEIGVSGDVGRGYHNASKRRASARANIPTETMGYIKGNSRCNNTSTVRRKDVHPFVSTTFFFHPLCTLSSFGIFWLFGKVEIGDTTFRMIFFKFKRHNRSYTKIKSHRASSLPFGCMPAGDDEYFYLFCWIVTR